MRQYVLDANAVVTYVDGRKGAEKVDSILRQALERAAQVSISAVNLGEAYYILMREMGEVAAERMVSALRQVVSFENVTPELAIAAARLKQKYKLPYADSVAAALAISEDAVLVTADPDFAKLGRALKLMKLPRAIEF